jgi:hypothetical protein
MLVSLETPANMLLCAAEHCLALCCAPPCSAPLAMLCRAVLCAGGASPRHISQRLSHLSTGRHHQRVTLSATAVSTWLATHAAAAASGISTLSLDLSHHMGSHDFTTASLDGLLQKLPQLTRVMLAGAVEGTDAYEPLGECRHIIAQACKRRSVYHTFCDALACMCCCQTCQRLHCTSHCTCACRLHAQVQALGARHPQPPHTNPLPPPTPCPPLTSKARTVSLF